MSQFEKGSLAFCFLFLLSHSKKIPKCTSKPSNEVPGAWTCWFPIEPGLLGRSPLPFPYSSCCCVRTNHSTHEHSHGTSLHSRLRHHCCLQFFTHHVSRPTGGIRNSKFSKQFQYFQYYVGDFTMVHGQKGFSTSHTQTLVHFLFLAFLYFVGPTQTATLKYSVQPCHDRTPNPFQYHG